VSFKYFIVDMPAHKAAEILSAALSPQKFYHHHRQGGVEWAVDTVSVVSPLNAKKTRITHREDVDDSVITYLLLKQ
jgi:hypothetical protein